MCRGVASGGPSVDKALQSTKTSRSSAWNRRVDARGSGTGAGSSGNDQGGPLQGPFHFLHASSQLSTCAFLLITAHSADESRYVVCIFILVVCPWHHHLVAQAFITHI